MAFTHTKLGVVEFIRTEQSIELKEYSFQKARIEKINFLHDMSLTHTAVLSCSIGELMIHGTKLQHHNIYKTDIEHILFTDKDENGNLHKKESIVKTGSIMCYPPEKEETVIVIDDPGVIINTEAFLFDVPPSRNSYKISVHLKQYKLIELEAFVCVWRRLVSIEFYDANGNQISMPYAVKYIR